MEHCHRLPKVSKSGIISPLEYPLRFIGANTKQTYENQPRHRRAAAGNSHLGKHPGNFQNRPRRDGGNDPDLWALPDRVPSSVSALAARRGYRLKQSFQKSFLLLGLTGVALHYTLQNIALLYTSAMSAALISAGGTFIITLTAILFLKEKPTLAQQVGIAVSVAGVTLISLAEDPNPNSTNPLLGNFLFLLGTVAWSAYTVTR